MQGTSVTGFTTLTTKLTGKLALMTQTIKKRLSLMESNVTSAINANSQAQSNSITWLAKEIGKFTDAELQITEDMNKKQNQAEVAQALSPTNADCVTATLAPGVEPELLREAGADSLDLASRNDFTNDENSPYSLGVTTALALQFVEYMSYYCNPGANNSNMPDASDPLVFRCIVDEDSDGQCDLLGGQYAVGTEIQYWCGSARTSDELINADIRIGDLMFGSTTWPRNTVSGCEADPDQDGCLGSQMHAAAKQMNRLLNVSPRNPFNTSAFDKSTGIEAFMERRTFEARSLMAETQFNYINSKRLPTINRGQWVKENIKKELYSYFENAIGTGGEATWGSVCGANDLSSLTGDQKKGCALYLKLKDMPDIMSHAQYMDFMLMDRFMGTNYYLEAKGMPNQIRKQQLSLMAHSLIQQREINNTLERLLGVMAAKYALHVDQSSNINPIEVQE